MWKATNPSTTAPLSVYTLTHITNQPSSEVTCFCIQLPLVEQLHEPPLRVYVAAFRSALQALQGVLEIFLDSLTHHVHHAEYACVHSDVTNL